MNNHSVSAAQAKFIHSRIDNVEHHFGLLCEGFATVARKNAKCRDSMDDFARVIVAYADTETLNRTTRTQVTHLADVLCGIADLQQKLVQKIETRVVGGLALYQEACKNARTDLTTSFKAQGREAKTGHKLEAVREKAPGDLRQVSQAEANLQRAVFDVARTHAALEESIEYFEMKKLRDLRRILLEFCHAKLTYHGKSLEMFSRSYNIVEGIQIESDVEEFKKALMFPSGNLQYRAPDMMSRSMMHLNRPVAETASIRQLDSRYNPNSPASDRRAQAYSGYNAHARTQSLDREYGTHQGYSRTRFEHNDDMQQSYALASRSSGGFGGGVRSSRSRST